MARGLRASTGRVWKGGWAVAVAVFWLAAAGQAAPASRDLALDWLAVAPMLTQHHPGDARATAPDLRGFISRVEADRQLLAELRKPMPETRSDGQRYLARIKELAARSDPVRLVPLVDRVLDQSGAYFDWLEREGDTPEQRAMQYHIAGARAFFSTFEQFKSAVLLTVVNRLDTIVDLLGGGTADPAD